MSLTPVWTKSSASGGGNGCVEVRLVDGGVQLRDSKAPAGGVIPLTLAGWPTVQASTTVEPMHWFTVEGVQFRPLSGGGLEISTPATTESPAIVLVFNELEAQAFKLGVRAGEFDPPAGA